MITGADLDQYFHSGQALPDGSEHAPGVLFNVPEAHYRAFRGLNSSLLKHQTAAEMWHDMNEPPEDHWRTEAAAEKWTMGILVHWAVLEPFKLMNPDRYIAESPTKGLATQKAMAVRAESPHKLVVTPELIEKATECLAAIRAHGFAQQVLNVPAGREASLFYFDKQLEVWTKARFDFVPVKGSYILDVKTTAKALPLFKWEMKTFGYHIQAAHYLDTWEKLTGERKEVYTWIVVTKEPPFMAKVFHLDNWAPGHLLYEHSPLKEAREILAARQATWITSAHETQAALRKGMSLDPSLTRNLWPAYEFDQPESTPIIWT